MCMPSGNAGCISLAIVIFMTTANGMHPTFPEGIHNFLYFPIFTKYSEILPKCIPTSHEVFWRPWDLPELMWRHLTFNIVGPRNARSLVRAYGIFVSYDHLYRKHFCHFLCSVIHKYYHKRVQTAYKGWHCFSPILRHILADDFTNNYLFWVISGLFRFLYIDS